MGESGNVEIAGGVDLVEDGCLALLVEVGQVGGLEPLDQQARRAILLVGGLA